MGLNVCSFLIRIFICLIINVLMAKILKFSLFFQSPRATDLAVITMRIREFQCFLTRVCERPLMTSDIRVGMGVQDSSQNGTL